MINIKVGKNLNKQFTAIKNQIEQAANKEFRRQILVMFNDLVRHSPQWSGDFASNWWATSKSGGGSYTPIAFKGHTSSHKDNIHQMGDYETIANTLRRANGIVVNYKFPMYFVNHTPLAFLDDYVYGEGQPYPGAHMSAYQKVRPQNLVGGTVALGAYLAGKYSKAI